MLTACTFSTSQLPKVVRAWCALYILTWKFASCHNGVHFFNISTSKSGLRMVHILTWKCASRDNAVHFFNISTSKRAPNPWYFSHFGFEMYFAPRRRGLFQHPNFNWQNSSVGLLTCFAPQWDAIFHLSSPQMAPHRPL